MTLIFHATHHLSTCDHLSTCKQLGLLGKILLNNSMLTNVGDNWGRGTGREESSNLGVKGVGALREGRERAKSRIGSWQEPGKFGICL